MKPKIRFGIIGCGTISSWYAQSFAQIDRAELYGVFDVNAQFAEAFAEKYGTRRFKTVEEMLASDVDAVCICTPSGLHADYVLQISAAGKNVVVEKPMGITTEQLDSIVAACEKNHTKLCAISQLAFSDAFIKARSAVEAGRLGKLILGDVTMKYFRSEEYYRAGGWRGTVKMDGGGALMNQGIHGVSLLLNLMGPVKSVTALTRTLVHSIEVEDTAVAALEFANGALGYIVGTTSVTPGLPRVLNIHGTKGTITLTEDKITQWDIEGEASGAVCAEGPMQNTSSDPGGFSIENHKRQLNDFIAALDADKSPRLDEHEGRRPVDLILAIYESSKTGRTVYLK